MEAIAVERSKWLAAPQERVWRAISEPAQLEQWYAPGCPWEIPSLHVGAIVVFYNTDTDIQRGTIEITDPPRQLTIRWQPDPMYPGATLLNTFCLEQENNGTLVTVTQMGYESLPNDVRQTWIDADAGAYTAILEQLKVYLERVSHEQTTAASIRRAG